MVVNYSLCSGEDRSWVPALVKRSWPPCEVWIIMRSVSEGRWLKYFDICERENFVVVFPDCMKLDFKTWLFLAIFCLIWGSSLVVLILVYEF